MLSLNVLKNDKSRKKNPSSFTPHTNAKWSDSHLQSCNRSNQYKILYAAFVTSFNQDHDYQASSTMQYKSRKHLTNVHAAWNMKFSLLQICVCQIRIASRCHSQALSIQVYLAILMYVWLRCISTQNGLHARNLLVRFLSSSFRWREDVVFCVTYGDRLSAFCRAFVGKHLKYA